MNFNCNKSLVALILSACLINVNAQTKRHYIPNGKGVVQTAEIIFKERPSESRFTECTRCHGTKKTTVDVDQVFKVILAS